MEAVLWSGQCSAGKPWVLHLCECYFDMYHLFKDHIHLSWQWCSLKAVVSCSRIMHLPHCRNCSGMVRGTWQRVQGVALASNLSRSQSNRVSMGYAGPKNPSMPRQLTKQSDCWCWEGKKWSENHHTSYNHFHQFWSTWRLSEADALLPFKTQLFVKLLQCSNKMRGVIFCTAPENERRFIIQIVLAMNKSCQKVHC